MCRHLQNICIGINNIVNMRPRHSIVNMYINLKHHLVHLRSLIMTCLSWSSITWSALTQRLLVHLLWLNMMLCYVTIICKFLFALITAFLPLPHWEDAYKLPLPCAEDAYNRGRTPAIMGRRNKDIPIQSELLVDDTDHEGGVVYHTMHTNSSAKKRKVSHNLGKASEENRQNAR